MANPAYGKCYPFENVDQQAREAEWRHYGGAFGDGIVGAPRADGSSAFSLLRSTSDRTVTLNLADFRMRGIMFEPTTDTLSLTIPAIATGQVRADRVLARFDNVAKQITFYVKAGTAVASTATPPRPSFSRVSGGVWEIPLWLLTGGNVAASQLAAEDHRVWLGDIMHVNEAPAPWGGNTELNQGRPDGSRAYHLPTGNEFVQTYPGGIPTWTNLDDPPWSDLNVGGGIVTGQARMQYRVRRGQVEVKGHGLRANGAVWGPYSTLSEILVGTLPESLAPAEPYHWIARVSGGTGPNYVGAAPLYVLPTGEIKMTLYAGMGVAGVWYNAIRYTPKG